MRIFRFYFFTETFSFQFFFIPFEKERFLVVVTLMAHSLANHLREQNILIANYDCELN